MGIAYLAGARFDIAASQFKSGKFSKLGPGEIEKLVAEHDHREL